MRSYATPTLSVTPAAAALQRACDCDAQAPSDEMCPDCAAKSAGVRPRLTIGPVDDLFEREADAMAEQMVPHGSAPEAIRRQTEPQDEDDEKLRLKPEVIRRDLNDDDDDVVQPKRTAVPGLAGAVQMQAPMAADAVAGGGAPLSRADRAFFEPRFGRDLGHVRLHTDAGAGRAARLIGARAYTLRNHIAFAAGQFAPGTSEGRRLLAHELTHTLQQAGPTLRREPFDEMGANQNGGEPRSWLGPKGWNEDPREPGQSTLTYAQSRELTKCLEIMGNDDVSSAGCAEAVLGIPMPEWKSVPGISSPVPFRAGVSATGTATTTVGPVSLTILPDTTSTDPAMQNGAETKIDFAPLPAGTNAVNWVSHNGRVSSFTFNQDLFAMTIQTTFGPGVSAASSSGYGRGTTPDDKQSGQTSLGFHEGEHGRDFINYLKNKKYPVFAGKIGQTTAVFRAHVVTFQAAVSTYVRTMTRLSELRTDCAGKSKDTFNAAKGLATTMCVRKPGDPVP